MNVNEAEDKAIKAAEDAFIAAIAHSIGKPNAELFAKAVTAYTQAKHEAEWQ